VTTTAKPGSVAHVVEVFARMASQQESQAESDVSLVRMVLSGQAASANALVRLLEPVVRGRVARILWRHRSSVHPARQDVLDLTQEVFAALFADGGRVLRDWDVSRGLSLRNFAGLVAERTVLSTLRKRERWSEELGGPATVEVNTAEPSGERTVISRDTLEKLFMRLRQTLSQERLELFHRLFVDEQSVEEIRDACDLTPNAIYQWRTRLGKLARATLLEIEVRDASEVLESRLES
jgi:DNA-directed RNA polymerase specialized sigma24 family protein